MRNRPKPPTVCTVRRFAAAVLLALTLGACSSGEKARPGLDEVYNRIKFSTDCQQLQAEFNAAADNAEHFAGGTRNHKISRSYMEAADDRLEEIGCYDR